VDSENRLYSKWILYLPAIFIAILFFVFITPEILSLIEGTKIFVPVLSDIQYSDRLVILLTFAITIFTMVGSYSTYLQVVFAQSTSRIEDARNELEKAYGPLYSLLNSLYEGEHNTIRAREAEKQHMDNIFATYPFMFPPDIYDDWIKKVQPIKLTVYPRKEEVPMYHIPNEFRNKLNEEYSIRVERYNKLLGKDRGLQSIKGRKMSEDDREFQLEMLRVQQLSDGFSSLMTILITIAISWIVASLAIIYSTGIEPQVKVNFQFDLAYMFVALVIGLILFLGIEFWFLPREINKLRKRFVKPTKPEAQQQKTN